jgi:hypothetical protein
MLKACEKYFFIDLLRLNLSLKKTSKHETLQIEQLRV